MTRTRDAVAEELLMVHHEDWGWFQLAGIPGDETTWGVPVWDGNDIANVCPERLWPASKAAEEMIRMNYHGPLGRNPR